MAIRLGYISTEQDYESIKSYSSQFGFENVGYIHSKDFEKDNTFNADLATNFANRVDAVVVSENLQHEETLPFLLRNSKHVLVLNGVQSIFKQGKQLENLLEEGGTVFQLNCFSRTKPVFTALRQYIKRPNYAKFERWTKSSEDLFAHLANDLDMALACFQSRVKDVICHTSNVFDAEQIDLLSLKVLFHNGASADILIHGNSAENRCEALFTGLNGYYKVDFAKQEIVQVELAGSNQLSLMEGGSDSRSSLVHKEKRILSFDYLQKAMRNFEENINFGFTPLVNVADLKRVAEVLQKTEYIMQRNCVNWV